MKTWTFVTAVFWLFYNLPICPHSEEQTTADGKLICSQTTIIDRALQKWYFANCIRPPPPCNWDPYDLT
jgi:hypothetical protein